MYKVKVKGYGYMDNNFGEVSMEFKFDDITEAGEFVDSVIDHSEYTKFEIVYEEEV